jgi:hypothetical protein
LPPADGQRDRRTEQGIEIEGVARVLAKVLMSTFR